MWFRFTLRIPVGGTGRALACAAVAGSLVLLSVAASAAQAEKPQTAVVGLTPGCVDIDQISVVVGHVARSLSRGGQLREIPIKDGMRPATAGALSAAAASLEDGKRHYHEIRYAEARKTFIDALARLVDAVVPLAEDGKRWILADTAAAFIALSKRASGDENGYREVISGIARARPMATFDAASYPPYFRKAIEEAFEKGSAESRVPLTITATVGTWRVRVDGADRGFTPQTVQVIAGTHQVGVVGPDDLVRNTAVRVEAAGARFEIIPIDGYAKPQGGGVTVCLPQGHEVTDDDGPAVLSGFKPPAVLTASMYRHDVMLSLAAGPVGTKKPRVVLPAAEARDPEKVAAAIRSLYGVTPSTSWAVPEAGSQMNPYRLWGHVGVWGGVAIIGLGGLFTALASKAADDYSRGDSHFGSKDDMSTYNAAAVTGYILGGTMVATGVVLWMLDPGDEKRAKGQRVSLSYTLEQGRVGLVVRGGW